MSGRLSLGESRIDIKNIKIIKTKPDIKAVIYFLTSEEGGKKSPVPNGYRGTHDFGVSNMFNDAIYEFIGTDLE